MKKNWFFNIILVSMALRPSFAQSQLNEPNGPVHTDWEISTLNANTTEAIKFNILNDDCNSGQSDRVISVTNTTVFLRLGIDGTVAASYNIGAEIENKPAVVKLSDGKWYVFVTASNGYLYKLDVLGTTNGGTPMGIAVNATHTQKISLRRSSDTGCFVKDKITASPVVQLASESNSEYTLGKDIVFAATHHGCGSTTTNMVYAFNAADITLAPIWVFNEYGDYSADYFTNILLDTDRNTIFCTSNLDAGKYQNTIWSLNTLTGNLKWAKNSNSIHSMPVLGKLSEGGINHLYLMDMIGNFHAINPDIGTEYWNLLLNPAPGTYVNLPLTIGKGNFAKEILVTDISGILYAVYDNGDVSGVVLWSIIEGGNVKIKTSPAIMGDTEKCFVGLDNGTIHQINITTGSDQGYIGTILPAPGSVMFPNLTIYQIGSHYKLVASFQGVDNHIRQYNIPSFIPYPNMNEWIGNISSAWELNTNWSKLAIPTAIDDVQINCGSTIIISSPNAICHKLSIDKNAILTVNPDAKLSVEHQ